MGIVSKRITRYRGFTRRVVWLRLKDSTTVEPGVTCSLDIVLFPRYHRFISPKRSGEIARHTLISMCSIHSSRPVVRLNFGLLPEQHRGSCPRKGDRFAHVKTWLDVLTPRVRGDHVTDRRATRAAPTPFSPSTYRLQPRFLPLPFSLMAW